jgi:hypothetical protein
MKNTTTQIKHSIESQPNRMEEVENRISGKKERVQGLTNQTKTKKKILREYGKNMQDH